MNPYEIQAYALNFEPALASSQKRHHCSKYDRNVTIMMSSTQNHICSKILINTSLLTKFGVRMTFGLELR